MNLTSATLLQRLRDRRDSDAWERLVGLYSPLIRSWLRRHLPQSADVDDLAQQVLTVVVEKLPAFEHSGRPGAFRAWLRSISVNRLRMFWRSHPNLGTDPEPVLLQLEDPHSDLSQVWDREHDEHVAQKLLEAIEGDFYPTTWMAFRRQVVDGAEPEAVAAELSLTLSTVYAAKSRVLRRLREEMASLGVM
jgi:RNA polymerase sigma-70 factor (ECF subfamily)